MPTHTTRPTPFLLGFHDCIPRGCMMGVYRVHKDVCTPTSLVTYNSFVYNNLSQKLGPFGAKRPNA